jgi:hypothetical protein
VRHYSLLLRQFHGDEGRSVTIELETGRSYRFRYVVNGEE